MSNNKKELAYYLTLFKIEGHETWRSALKSDKLGFDREVEIQSKSNQSYPTITDKKVYRIDRMTGEVSQV